MTTKRTSVGFGHAPDMEAHHYVVTIPKDGPVTTHEQYGDESPLSDEHLRCVLHRQKWDAIAMEMQHALGNRCKEVGLRAGRWRRGENKVARLLGKELLVLMWAIEDADRLEDIERAFLNWSGLSPEERWWLATMTGAQTAHHSMRGVGWRAALHHAFVGNPVVTMGRFAHVPKNRAAVGEAVRLREPQR